MADTITKIGSEYDMVEIMQKIGENYFGSGLSQQRVGMFGYLTESMAHMFGASILDSSARAKEYNTSTAQRLETLLYEAAMYDISVDNAAPESMTAYIGIQTSDIINPSHQGGFSYQEKDENNLDHPICTLVLEKDTVINIADYDFMFEYDIQIRATWSATANKYMYSVKYLTEGDTDITSTSSYTYPKANTLTQLYTTYIQSYVTTKNDASVLLFKVNLKQMSKYTDYYTVTKNDMISLTGIDFLYNNMLSHFNVYYKENNKNDWEYIKAVSIYDNKTYDEKIVHYEIIHDESKIRINFDDFTPAYNSEFRIDMYSTLGETVNNINYTGDGSDIIITLNTLDERHNYSGLYLSCVPITSYGEGKNVPDLEDIRNQVIRMKASLNSLDTEYDLYNYIKGKDSLNDYVFIKKRSDSKERRYSAFTIPRMETDEIIPSSTLNLILPLSGDIYSGGTHESGLEFPDASLDLSTETGKDKVSYGNIVTLKAGTPLIINSNRDTSEKESYKLSINAINNYYENNYTGNDDNKKFHTDNTLMVLDRSETIVDNNGQIKDKYPDLKTIAEYESSEKIFATPYTISYDKENQITSFYLNSISEDVEMTMVEDENKSSVHFVIDHINIYRNALMGDKSYKVTVSVMPNGDHSKAIIEEYANTGNVANVVMLKGYMYKTSNDQIVDGYFDFKFDGYSDDVFTFSADIIIDDSMDDDSSCSIMTNLHMIEELYIDNDNIGTYEEMNEVGKIIEYKYSKAKYNPGYLNMNIFNLKLGIGIYFLDYDPDKFISTITSDTDSGESVLIEASDTSAQYVTAKTHSIETGTAYPDFVIHCKYKDTETSDITTPIKYTLTNVYTNNGNLIDLYTDMSDFVKSTANIITAAGDIYEKDSNGEYYWSKTYKKFRLINDLYITDEEDSRDPNKIANRDTLTEEDAKTLEDKTIQHMELETNVSPNDTLDYVLTARDASGIDELEAVAKEEYEEGVTQRYTLLKNVELPFILLQDVPVMQFSKAISSDISTRLIKTIDNTRMHLDEMNEKITNNFSIDYKFFRTYGPCRYYTLSTVDGNDKLVSNVGCCTDPECTCDENKPATIAYEGIKSLGNLDITIEFTILIRNGLSVSDADVVSKLKSHIKSYIEKLNEQETDYTIYMSNIITELETNYIEFIKSIELVSINGESDVYRILRYNLPEEIRSDTYSTTTNDIREYIPEYINVPLENIIINVTRTRY